MTDKAYKVALYPTSMSLLTVDGANAIEANLQYLLSLFAMFDGEVTSEALGSLGYLELTETGSVGDGFAVITAVCINYLTISVTGEDLTALSWTGEGWAEESRSRTALQLVRDFGGFVTADSLQEALAALTFTSTADLDAQLRLTAASAPEVVFDTLGPVEMVFRGGATWALIEDKALTWETVEAAELNWSGLESMTKETTI